MIKTHADDRIAKREVVRLKLRGWRLWSTSKVPWPCQCRTALCIVVLNLQGSTFPRVTIHALSINQHDASGKRHPSTSMTESGGELLGQQWPWDQATLACHFSRVNLNL